MNSRIKTTLGAACFVLLIVALLNAQLELARSWGKHHERRVTDIVFPSNEWIRLISLNYNTMAADLLWVTLITQHGEFLRVHGQAAENVLSNGVVAARTDPNFYRLYDWLPAAYLNRRHPITEDDLHKVVDLYDIGIAQFPGDAELRFSAALTFIGYGKGFSDASYVRQCSRAIEYLEPAVQLAPDDEQMLGVLEYFRKRKRKYSGEEVPEDRETEVAFWLEMMSTSPDRMLRQRATERLQELGGGKEVLARQQALIDVHRSSRPYLPFPLWAIVDESEQR